MLEEGREIKVSSRTTGDSAGDGHLVLMCKRAARMEKVLTDEKDAIYIKPPGVMCEGKARGSTVELLVQQRRLI